MERKELLLVAAARGVQVRDPALDLEKSRFDLAAKLDLFSGAHIDDMSLPQLVLVAHARLLLLPDLVLDPGLQQRLRRNAAHLEEQQLQEVRVCLKAALGLFAEEHICQMRSAELQLVAHACKLPFTTREELLQQLRKAPNGLLGRANNKQAFLGAGVKGVRSAPTPPPAAALEGGRFASGVAFGPLIANILDEIKTSPEVEMEAEWKEEEAKRQALIARVRRGDPWGWQGHDGKPRALCSDNVYGPCHKEVEQDTCSCARWSPCLYIPVALEALGLGARLRQLLQDVGEQHGLALEAYDADPRNNDLHGVMRRPEWRNGAAFVARGRFLVFFAATGAAARKASKTADVAEQEVPSAAAEKLTAALLAFCADGRNQLDGVRPRVQCVCGHGALWHKPPPLPQKLMGACVQPVEPAITDAVVVNKRPESAQIRLERGKLIRP
jgi:hypothetical protein